MVVIIIVLIIIALIVRKYLINKKTDVTQDYYGSNNSQYSIVGRKDRFTITKDGQYMFRVVNGDIVEVHDKKNHTKAKYEKNKWS